MNRFFYFIFFPLIFVCGGCGYRTTKAGMVAEVCGEQYNSIYKFKPSEGVLERLGDHLC